MSQMIHLLSPQLRVRLKLEQLVIADRAKNTERPVPVEDIAAVICAAPDASFTAGALRFLAQKNVPLLICNERFEPCAMTLPYHRATDTELLRRQVEWTAEWKDGLFRQIITMKVRQQAANLLGKNAHALEQIAARCSAGTCRQPELPGPGKSLARVTSSRRELLHADTPAASESRAARLYWRAFLPPLVKTLGSGETRREPGTRHGVNGMLDYGYAILRTAVLRSLAVRGFIAAIGVHHASRAGSFALADDLIEPLRPFMDRALQHHLSNSLSLWDADGKPAMQPWMKAAGDVLLSPVRMKSGQVRLLHAIDLYVRSFADACLKRRPDFPLAFPRLEPLQPVS